MTRCSSRSYNDNIKPTILYNRNLSTLTFVGKTAVVATLILLSGIITFFRYTANKTQPTLLRHTGSDRSSELSELLRNSNDRELLELTLRKRVLDIRHRCQLFSGPSRRWREKPPILMVKSINIEYCCTAKTGTSFWKVLMPKVKSQKLKFSTPDAGGKIVSSISS